MVWIGSLGSVFFKTCLVAMPARTRERKGPKVKELPSNNTLRVVMIILVDKTLRVVMIILVEHFILFHFILY